MGGTVRKDNNQYETTERTQSRFQNVRTCATCEPSTVSQFQFIHEVWLTRNKRFIFYWDSTIRTKSTVPYSTAKNHSETAKSLAQVWRRSRLWNRRSFACWMQSTSSRPISQRPTVSSFRLHLSQHSFQLLQIQFYTHFSSSPCALKVAFISPFLGSLGTAHKSHFLPTSIILTIMGAYEMTLACFRVSACVLSSVILICMLTRWAYCISFFYWNPG